MDHSLLFIAAVLALLIGDILLFLLGYSLRHGHTHGSDAATAFAAETAKEIAVVHRSMMSLIQRLSHLEERLKQVESRQEDLRSRDAEGQVYDVAAKLVHKGASVDELMSVCGISRGEAELIINLHDMKSE